MNPSIIIFDSCKAEAYPSALRAAERLILFTEELLMENKELGDAEKGPLYSLLQNSKALYNAEKPGDSSYVITQEILPKIAKVAPVVWLDIEMDHCFEYVGANWYKEAALSPEVVNFLKSGILYACRSDDDTDCWICIEELAEVTDEGGELEYRELSPLAKVQIEFIRRAAARNGSWWIRLESE